MNSAAPSRELEQRNRFWMKRKRIIRCHVAFVDTGRGIHAPSAPREWNRFWHCTAKHLRRPSIQHPATTRPFHKPCLFKLRLLKPTIHVFDIMLFTFFDIVLHGFDICCHCLAYVCHLLIFSHLFTYCWCVLSMFGGCFGYVWGMCWGCFGCVLGVVLMHWFNI